MKRYPVLLMLLCCLLMTACGALAPESAPSEEDIAPISPADNTRGDWGITLSAESVTTSGLTLRCVQSGGEPSGELSTGSFYVLERKTETSWEAMEYAPQEYEIGWTSEAWIIPMNGDVTWDVNWVWFYGTLPEGAYRIGKNIMDWRAPGDYDQQMAYAEFEVPELLICDGLPLAPTDK